MRETDTLRYKGLLATDAILPREGGPLEKDCYSFVKAVLQRSFISLASCPVSPVTHAFQGGAKQEMGKET